MASNEELDLDEIFPKLLCVEEDTKPEELKAYLANSTGRWRGNRTCYHCGKKGHIKAECRRRADDKRERN
jgi:Zinc knuckle